MSRSLSVAWAVAVVAPFVGCVATTYVAPLSTQDIIELSEKESTPEDIIAEINRTRTVYVLRARDVKDLLDKGSFEHRLCLTSLGLVSNSLSLGDPVPSRI